MTQHIATDTIATDDTAKRRRRSRMIRAILAGGLVLGVGTAVTLAAWTDTEVVSGTFGTGQMNLQGNLLGGTGDWADHTVEAPLTFTVAPSQLAPGTTVFAPFAVRLAPNTSVNAGVVIAAVTTATVTDLTYTLTTRTAFGCDAVTTGETSVIGSTAVTAGTVGSAGTLSLTKESTLGAGGTPVYLCFRVTGGSNLQQQANTKLTWTFTATSI